LPRQTVEEMRLRNTWLLQNPSILYQRNFTKTRQNVAIMPAFTDQMLAFWRGLIHNSFKPFNDDI